MRLPRVRGLSPPSHLCSATRPANWRCDPILPATRCSRVRTISTRVLPPPSCTEQPTGGVTPPHPAPPQAGDLLELAPLQSTSSTLLTRDPGHMGPLPLLLDRTKHVEGLASLVG